MGFACLTRGAKKRERDARIYFGSERRWIVFQPFWHAPHTRDACGTDINNLLSFSPPQRSLFSFRQGRETLMRISEKKALEPGEKGNESARGTLLRFLIFCFPDFSFFFFFALPPLHWRSLYRGESFFPDRTLDLRSNKTCIVLTFWQPLLFSIQPARKVCVANRNIGQICLKYFTCYEVIYFVYFWSIFESQNF